MDWNGVIDLILTLIDRCTEKDGDDAVEERLQRGGLRVRLGVRGILQEQGLRGAALRQQTQEIMEELQSATTEEISSLIQQAKNAEVDTATGEEV